MDVREVCAGAYQIHIHQAERAPQVTFVPPASSLSATLRRIIAVGPVPGRGTGPPWGPLWQGRRALAGPPARPLWQARRALAGPPGGGPGGRLTVAESA